MKHQCAISMLELSSSRLGMASLDVAVRMNGVVHDFEELAKRFEDFITGGCAKDRSDYLFFQKFFSYADNGGDDVVCHEFDIYLGGL